jgi:hypothetical protein
LKNDGGKRQVDWPPDIRVGPGEGESAADLDLEAWAAEHPEEYEALGEEADDDLTDEEYEELAEELGAGWTAEELKAMDAAFEKEMAAEAKAGDEEAAADAAADGRARKAQEMRVHPGAHAVYMLSHDQPKDRTPQPEPATATEGPPVGARTRGGSLRRRS